MLGDHPGKANTVDVHARITRVMYEQLVQECTASCCSITAFIRSAVGRQLVDRKQARQKGSSHAILVGQIEFEGLSDANR